MTRLFFIDAVLRLSPPWLRRAVGSAIMQGMGKSIDAEVDRDVEGVELRFPGGANGLAIHASALGLIGRERRILRGPGELDETYAARLRRWWDSHRTRGGAYALLEQMFEYFLATNNVTITYVSNIGTSQARVDAAGTITRGTFTAPGWVGDGFVPPSWARFFIFMELDGTTLGSVLTTESGDIITTEDGEPVIVTIPILSLTASDFDMLCAVPREWSSAHIDRIYFALLPTGGIVWGFPASLVWGAAGKTWGGDAAITFTC